MKYYLLPVTGQVEEVAGSAFRYVICGECGNSFRKQEKDLVLRVLEPVGPFTTTIDGDLVACEELARSILTLEPTVSLRSASLDGAAGTWFQVISTKCAELADFSLRAPRTHCGRCGGITRVQLGDSPPLVLAAAATGLPHFDHVCGAPLMTILSSEVSRVLSDADPGFSATEVQLA